MIKQNSIRIWLIMLIVVVLLIGGITLMKRLPPPAPPMVNEETPPPITDKEATPVEVRSIVVTDGEIEPMLPLSGASLHFIAGNKAQVGYKFIPIKPVLTLGVTGGRLWFSGIPSFINLEGIDKNIYDYFSRDNPDWEWRFAIDLSSQDTDILTASDGLIVRSTTPTLDWSAVDCGEECKYTIEISSSKDFSTPLIRKTGWSTPSSPFTSYTLSRDEALAEGAYYWRLIEKGKLWVIGMLPWLDISKYDPEVTELPTIFSIETEQGQIKISYIPK